jgi:hypothetical protein
MIFLSRQIPETSLRTDPTQIPGQNSAMRLRVSISIVFFSELGCGQFRIILLQSEDDRDGGVKQGRAALEGGFAASDESAFPHAGSLKIPISF